MKYSMLHKTFMHKIGRHCWIVSLEMKWYTQGKNSAILFFFFFLPSPSMEDNF